MKRFVIATASALILLAGSAGATVPKGPASRLAHDNSFSSSMEGMPVGLAPLAPGIDPAVLADPDLALPGLPGGVKQLFEAVDPALSALAGVVPPAVDNLVAAAPAPAPPAPVPGVTPAPEPPKEQKKAAPPPAPTRKQAKGLTRKADLQAAAVPINLFKNLGPNGYAGYGTASVIHTDLLDNGTQRIENLDAAFSSATFSSVALPEDMTNEMARVVSPILAAGNAYARGSGVEVGLAINKSAPNQIIPGSVAEAKAPPSTDLKTTQVGPVDVKPLLGATLLRGQAQSKANAACTTGTDLSNGLGYAADLGLLGDPNAAIDTTTTDPERAVSQSRSHTFLVAQEGAPSPIRKFGLSSETRQTIAPVTLFKGTPAEFTIEFAGEWVLRATADGVKGSVFYGPGNVSPQTKILNIFGPAVSSPLEVTTQALLGANGLNLTIPNIAEIVIGEKPRAIGGTGDPTQTATAASGAVDVVRVRILAGAPVQLADVRIGHMEVATAVPAGGIECGIGVVKNTDKDVVGPGDVFTWTIKVTNPNDCFLTKLKVVDTITATTGIIWTVESANVVPKADQVANGGVTWNDLGTLKPGESKELRIPVKLSDKTGGGKFLDVAEASGVCGPAAGTAGAEGAVGVPLSQRVELNLPEVNAALGANLLPRELPRTGGVLAVLPALALTGGGLILRSTRRRKQR